MRIKISLLLLLFILLIPALVLANATPVYIEEYPGLSISPMEDSSIEVKREELFFNIDEDRAWKANVEANYTLKNLSDDSINVPIIFPLITDSRDRDMLPDTEIKLNDKHLDYQMFSAGNVEVNDYLENPEAFANQISIDKLVDNLNELSNEAEAINDDNIFLYLFEVDFEGNSTNELEISYPMKATMDRSESRDYINTFAYLLHPAENFQGFGELDIRIELNESAPYILDASIPLSKVEDEQGVYEASLSGLPEDDLVFSTYPREEITWWDSFVAEHPVEWYGVFFTVGMITLGIAFIGIAIILIITILTIRFVKAKK